MGRQLIAGPCRASNRASDRASDRASNRAGFSLIELLVVIAILSVLSVGAVLATGRGGPDAPDMARFQGLFAQAQALAIAGRQARGLTLGPEGVQLAQATPEGWDISAMVQPWRGRVGFLPQAGYRDPDGPDITLLPDGRSTGFTLSFSTGGRCQSDGWTGLTCAAR